MGLTVENADSAVRFITRDRTQGATLPATLGTTFAKRLPSL